jgi:hypothetical protein
VDPGGFGEAQLQDPLSQEFNGAVDRLQACRNDKPDSFVGDAGANGFGELADRHGIDRQVWLENRAGCWSRVSQAATPASRRGASKLNLGH